tara:strand:- start:53 stop:286 length:234 start_codon:yes stop_codon:yes gene_type:complete
MLLSLVAGCKDFIVRIFLAIVNSYFLGVYPILWTMWIGVWIGENARIVHMVYELKTYIVDNVDNEILYCLEIGVSLV